VTFPSPTEACRTYLDARAAAAEDPARAYGGVPAPRPARFIRLMLAGATTTSVAHRDCRIVVECWEQSEYAAERLFDTVHGWLCDMDTDGGHVPAGRGGWVGGPYTQPDPATATPRCVATFILRQRRQP